MLRVLLAAAALAAVGLVQSGCATMCTLELRAAVHGYIVTQAGEAVVPDAVVAVKDGRDEACEVFDGGYYSCWERGGGTYEVRVLVGEQRWTYWIDVDDDGHSGCHVESVERDLVLGTP